MYSKVRSYDVNFGILPFPKYNEDQQEYSAAGYDIYWAIPLTTLNTDVAGTVVCAMSCYNYNQIVPLVWEVILGGKLSDMPDDADMFRIMRDVQYVDLGYACSMMKSDLQELVFLLYYTKPGQVASALKKQEKLANRVLENLNKTFDSLGECDSSVLFRNSPHTQGRKHTFTACNDPVVLTLSGASVINGYTDGTFSSVKTLTRAEISKINVGS